MLLPSDADGGGVTTPMFFLPAVFFSPVDAIVAAAVAVVPVSLPAEEEGFLSPALTGVSVPPLESLAEPRPMELTVSSDMPSLVVGLSLAGRPRRFGPSFMAAEAVVVRLALNMDMPDLGLGMLMALERADVSGTVVAGR